MDLASIFKTALRKLTTEKVQKVRPSFSKEVSLKRKAVPFVPFRNRYLVAVSGGRDSMVLLDLCRRTLPNNSIAVAHYDHQTREGESTQDAEFIRRFCHERDIPFVREIYPGKQKSEAALRQARLAFLEKARRSAKADFILTAHHANDNLETFLMRLIRGTSIQGLSGIKPKNGRYLKPLLEVPATEIHSYAKLHRIPFQHDKTNDSTVYFRNRLRHELIPQVIAMADIYGGEAAFLSRFSSLTSELRRTAQRETHLRKRLFVAHCRVSDFWMRVDAHAWQLLRGRSQALLLSEVGHRLLKRSLSRNEIRQITQAIHDGRSGHSLRGLRFLASCDQLYFFKTLPRNTFKFKKVGAAWKCPELGIQIKGISPECEVRFLLPGDAMGKTKLKKILLAQRVPKIERPFVPVVARKGTREVTWHPFKVTAGVSYQTTFPFTIS